MRGGTTMSQRYVLALLEHLYTLFAPACFMRLVSGSHFDKNTNQMLKCISVTEYALLYCM